MYRPHPDDINFRGFREELTKNNPLRITRNASVSNDGDSVLSPEDERSLWELVGRLRKGCEAVLIVKRADGSGWQYLARRSACNSEVVSGLIQVLAKLDNA